MRSLLLSTCFVSLLASCQTHLEAIATDVELEGWHVVHALDVPGKGNIIEWTPATESAQDWTEMVTIQFLENMTMPLPEAVAELEQKMRDRVPSVRWEVVDAQADSILYEWSFTDEAYGTQHELARMLRGNDGLHRIAYTRKAAIDAATRGHWLANLRGAAVWKKGAPIVLEAGGRP